MASTVISPTLFTLAGLGEPEREHLFAKSIGRKWAFDYCWPSMLLALEIEGGVWTRGRHTRGAGFLKDVEKYNAAVLMGYRLLRATPQMAENGDLLLLLQHAARVLT